jgi:hypothetical protein
VTHDVVIGPFDSGPMARFTSWSQQIDQPGGYPFLCTVHAFMRGTLDVVAATLAAARDGVLADEPSALSGRTTVGTASVALERRLDDGSWQALATTVPGPDGTFSFEIRPDATSSYRAVTAAGPSPVVTVDVTAQVAVRTTVRARRRHRLIRVTTRPAAPNVLATLQRYSRWHYIWRPLARRRLDARGRAMFTLPGAARGRVRIVLSRSRHAPPPTPRGPVRLSDGKPVADPLDTAVDH